MEQSLPYMPGRRQKRRIQAASSHGFFIFYCTVAITEKNGLMHVFLLAGTTSGSLLPSLELQGASLYPVPTCSHKPGWCGHLHFGVCPSVSVWIRFWALTIVTECQCRAWLHCLHLTMQHRLFLRNITCTLGAPPRWHWSHKHLVSYLQAPRSRVWCCTAFQRAFSTHVGAAEKSPTISSVRRAIQLRNDRWFRSSFTCISTDYQTEKTCLSSEFRCPVCMKTPKS